MSQSLSEPRPRILIVDDNPAIHEDFRKILGAKPDSQSRLDDIEAGLFGQADGSRERSGFRIDSAYQGQEAVALIQRGLEENDPYVLAFVDVRMPPGWDGVETLERAWQCAPELQAVICTAYSDYSWDDMTRRLGHTDNLLILKKPFETIEVLQLAHALTQKWTLARQAKTREEDLDRMVRQRTAELRGSEERFSKAFHCSPNPAAILRVVDRRFVGANQSFLELAGYTPEHLARHTDKELELWATAKDSNPAPSLPEGRLRNQACLLRRSDGTTRQIMLSAEPIDLGGTPCLLVNAEDVTDQLKLEAQLRQAQKMEVIGRMAAGIAHEFNNVLTVIQGDVGLLQSAIGGALDRPALLSQIMQASQRAASFTKQLLAFSRKQVLQPRPLNLSAVVQNTRKMLSRLIGEKFEIRLRCPEDLPSVMADEGGVEQILINLALNARDAMPDGGVIDIATEACVLDEAAAAANAEARPGRFVCLVITDEGCGMDTQILARIFDPFFTTKDVGKGTGLGLSTIHGIVKQHDGWVTVTSAVGRGSIFKIYLPAVDATPVPPAAHKPGGPATSDPAQGETILVVEDEMAVRELACAALQKRGYEVVKAANGPEAVEVWERCGRPVHLLLTDMVMPSGMSGSELAKILQSRNPNLKILYTSGYSPEIFRKDSVLVNGLNFLPKPYDFQSLLKAVRACLDDGKDSPPQNRRDPDPMAIADK